MNADYALQEIGAVERAVELFRQTLSRHGLSLERGKTTTLQINVGLLCNQICLHCHLSAGPGRKENMSAETADAVIAYAKRGCFETADITGGAPELNPNIIKLIEGFSHHATRLMFRSNLSVLNDGTRDRLMDLLKKKRAAIVASFPSLNEAQANSQRGKGIFERSIEALLKLNHLGYGGQRHGRG